MIQEEDWDADQYAALDIEVDLPLSLWPSRRILTICSCFLRATLSARSSSSIWSLILCASTSRSSRAAFSSGDSLGGGAVTIANGSEES